MTPVVLWFATQPDVRAFYAPSTAPLGAAPAHQRPRPGRRGVRVPRLPDDDAGQGHRPVRGARGDDAVRFAHLGKPELELFSTLAGGLVYGWLAWRTRSIVWGTIGHVYIVTLVTVAAASAA